MDEIKRPISYYESPKFLVRLCYSFGIIILFLWLLFHKWDIQEADVIDVGRKTILCRFGDGSVRRFPKEEGVEYYSFVSVSYTFAYGWSIDE